VIFFFSFLFAELFNDGGLTTIAILKIKPCRLASTIGAIKLVFEAFFSFQDLIVIHVKKQDILNKIIDIISYDTDYLLTVKILIR